MKRIILVLALVCLASCKKADNDIVISREEYNQLKNQDGHMYPKPFAFDDKDIPSGGSGILLGSDGHEYLETNEGYNAETLTHYVDCIKCAQRQQEFENRIIREIHYKDSIK
jgi:hypothetical protein